MGKVIKIEKSLLDFYMIEYKYLYDGNWEAGDNRVIDLSPYYQ